MPSNLDLLREGKVFEYEPGKTAHVDKDKKTLNLSSGRVIDVSNNPDYFPKNEGDVKRAKQRSYIEKGIKGTGGEFLHQYTSSGIPGSVSDWPSYLFDTAEDYVNRNSAKQKASERISKESPLTSAAATGANIATDIALTRGMSASKAAPLLTAGSAGSRLITEPGEVLGESALAFGAGKAVDIGGKWLGDAAKRRGEIRALPGQQQAVRNANMAGEEAVGKANALGKEEFAAQKNWVKGRNADIEAQHAQEVAARETKVFEAKQAYEAAKESEVSTANEIKRLKDEYKLAEQNHKEALKELPELQKKAQSEYSQNISKNVDELENSFPKNTKLNSDELQVGNFIDESINKSGLGGTAEARQSARILKSIFPEGELLTTKELAGRYKALEDAIQRSTPEVQGVLNNFKSHLGEILPSALERNIVATKLVPLLNKSIAKDVEEIIGQIQTTGARQEILSKATANTKQVLSGELYSPDILDKIASGEFSRDLASKILSTEDFLLSVAPAGRNPKALEQMGISHLWDSAQKNHKYFVDQITSKIDSVIAKNEISLTKAALDASKKLKKTLKKTYGLAEEIKAPNAPEMPELPQMPTPATAPKAIKMPAKPQFMGEPTQPTPQTFTPQPEPTLGPNQGISGRAGDILEKPLLGGGKGMINNPLTKLAGLKYLLGKGALPLEAAYAGAKGLTSPTAGGEIARMTFKQGGIQAVESWAQKYPSYHDGILESPIDRRSLTKEIENAQDIPIEQKALLQSKTNRGIPLISQS